MINAFGKDQAHRFTAFRLDDLIQRIKDSRRDGNFDETQTRLIEAATYSASGKPESSFVSRFQFYQFFLLFCPETRDKVMKQARFVWSLPACLHSPFRPAWGAAGGLSLASIAQDRFIKELHVASKPNSGLRNAPPCEVRSAETLCPLRDGRT